MESVRTMLFRQLIDPESRTYTYLIAAPLPDMTLVYPGNDYRGHTVSTIAEEKCWNPRFVDCPGNPASPKSRADFTRLMSNLNLPTPKKMLEAVSVSELCGRQLASTPDGYLELSFFQAFYN
jgi:hypothetical protein